MRRNFPPHRSLLSQVSFERRRLSDYERLNIIRPPKSRISFTKLKINPHFFLRLKLEIWWKQGLFFTIFGEVGGFDSLQTNLNTTDNIYTQHGAVICNNFRLQFQLKNQCILIMRKHLWFKTFNNMYFNVLIIIELLTTKT